MEIILNHIVPNPLASVNHNSDSIWGNLIELKAANKVLLNASSGKGKSTFTFIINGLRKDYSGDVTFDGKNIKSFDSNQWAKIRQNDISVIYQDLLLFPDLTVAENLILKNNLTNLFSEREMLEMLEMLEIDDKWNQKCGLLSMGQQQRVAIIRSLLQPYKWLIMDEPFSHLDKLNTQKCIQMIDKRCNEINAGFVMTSLGDYYEYEFDKELKL